MINKKRLLNRFLALVKIDSISLHEGRFVRYLKKELSKIGIRAYTDGSGRSIDGEVGNLRARVKGKIKKAPKILLNAHLDTVVPGKHIKPRVRGKYVCSDGKTILGADDKAGLAVILEALKALKEEKIRHGDIELLFTVAEEIGLLGSKNLSKKIDADFCFTIDGGDVSEIVNQAPSQDSIGVTILGKAAHAGVHPEEGISAIKVASEAIASMKLGRIDKETTANIGVIKGGVASNIIPEKVELKGEARSHNMKKLKLQIEHMKSMLKKSCVKHKAKLKFKITPAYRSFYIEKDEPCLVIVRKVAKKIGIKTILKKTGGGSDANIFNSYGVPTVILGAGADRVHTKKERVRIDDMVLGAKLLFEAIKESTRWNLRRSK